MRGNLSKFTPMNINIFTQMFYINMVQNCTPILRNMTHLGYSVFIILQNIACRMKKSLSPDWEVPNEFLIRFASFCPELKLYPDVKTLILTLFGPGCCWYIRSSRVTQDLDMLPDYRLRIPKKNARC